MCAILIIDIQAFGDCKDHLIHRLVGKLLEVLSECSLIEYPTERSHIFVTKERVKSIYLTKLC
jgi:hypothetical protein